MPQAEKKSLHALLAGVCLMRQCMLDRNIQHMIGSLTIKLSQHYVPGKRLNSMKWLWDMSSIFTEYKPSNSVLKRWHNWLCDKSKTIKLPIPRKAESFKLWIWLLSKNTYWKFGQNWNTNQGIVSMKLFPRSNTIIEGLLTVLLLTTP